jgi:hypothetical protein
MVTNTAAKAPYYQRELKLIIKLKMVTNTAAKAPYYQRELKLIIKLKMVTNTAAKAPYFQRATSRGTMENRIPKSTCYCSFLWAIAIRMAVSSPSTNLLRAHRRPVTKLCVRQIDFEFRITQYLNSEPGRIKTK